ncbi:rhamnosidase [Actinocatenispora thailandica]|uniref:alpha-L-rhamnosidase n=1 Tax=Actinocatenispora thailandica TaxID=227318 RepID=A0A7R7HXV3_9ACTN|nr:alpha-L-rhamnosidase [Actinocatenispora thailandica]BCJ35509.1 rhamnosidase [Actinocatenispora thailandica]
MTEPVRVDDLRAERLVDPIGVDEPAPQLSWRLHGTRRGIEQRAYRVVVAADADPLEGNVSWDSGWVASSDSVGIAYRGPALAPHTRYVFRVRVTDDRGTESDWSPPGSWETGQLDEARWTASWITAASERDAPLPPDLDTTEPLHSLHRIGAPGGAAATLRTSFELPGGRRVLAARTAFADDVTVRLNGTEVPAVGDAARALRTGTNEIAVHAPDGHAVGRLDVTLDGLPPRTVGTDDTWRTGDGELAVSLGPHGAPPWGRAAVTHRPSPYLRRAFRLDAPVRRARLYVTAAGLYSMRLNGTRVGSEHLAPGWTDYATRVPYQSHDVTALLRDGDNVLGAVLADGWYAGSVGFCRSFHYGHIRALRAELHVWTADGAHQVIGTDTGWRTGTGAVRHADLQHGTVVDARAEPAGWDAPGFGDDWPAAVPADGPAGRVTAAIAPPIRVRHELAPRSVTATPDGRLIVDFGQNLVGWLRLRVRGDAGRRIIVRHAEVLDHDGEPYLEALRTARATDEYVLAGGTDGEVFEPEFTSHGFRYAELTGCPAGAEITALVAYADMAAAGEFGCSDPRLDRLHDNILWSQRGNFLAVPTDCPQRDERLGWTGDAQVFAPTAAFGYDVAAFLRKWLIDVRDAQRPDGAITHVAPDVLGGQLDTPQYGSPGWGDAIVLVPAALHAAYGDTRVVRECLPAMLRWLDYLDRPDAPRHPGGGFADWLAVTPTDKDVVNAGYLAHSARVAARLARLVGQPDAAAHCTDIADRAAAAFRARYVGGDGRVAGGTQTGYVLALRAGLVTEAERPAVVRRLAAEVAARNTHLSTGFLGTPWLLDALADGGRLDVAYALLLRDTYPSWLFPVVHGDATTIWERWDSWSQARGFADAGMTSFNHYAYGAVGDFLHRVVGGLAPAEPGYRRITVRPRPGGGIDSADTRLVTGYGPAAVRWQAEPYRLAVEVPPNTTADVHLPAGVEPPGTDQPGVRSVTPDAAGGTVVWVGSGTYEFAG